MASANLYTVSHGDYDLYKRCPRLLAVKSYLKLYPPPRQQRTRTTKFVEVQGIPTHIRGKVGEAFTAELLGNFEQAPQPDVVIERTLETIAKRQEVTEDVRRQVEQAVVEADDQSTDIRALLEQRYGHLELLGRGKAHYGHVPGYAEPDFVARANGKTTILVEAKNVLNITTENLRKAEWYNGVATAESLQVKWVPESNMPDHGSIVGAFGQPQECAIVNWGDGEVVAVTDRIDVSKAELGDMWRCKCLGFGGQIPEYDCDSKCLCKRTIQRYGLQLQVGNIPIERPPALSLATAQVESNVDLDLYGTLSLARSVFGPGAFRSMQSQYRRDRNGAPAIEQVMAKLGLARDRARIVLNGSKEPDETEVNLTGPWARLDSDVFTDQGIRMQASRTFEAATKSGHHVKRSNQAWDKLEG